MSKLYKKLISAVFKPRMASQDDDWDVLLIGGGIVGCANFFHLTNLGYRCALVEKEPNIVSQVSAGNSGMLHTGFDAPPDSIELACIRKSFQRLPKVLRELDLPVQKIGATMVAWDTKEFQELSKIRNISKENGIDDVSDLSLTDLYKKEPNLSPGATGALFIPGETIVDPWLTAVGFAHCAKKCGSRIFTNHMVQVIDKEKRDLFIVHTNKGILRGRAVINCAGLFGDTVDLLGGYTNFRILPRKGQYTVYSKTAASVINSSILPVPNEMTKGVIVFKTVYGNVVVGPTAENIELRSFPSKIETGITTKLSAHARKVTPNLLHHQVVGMFTGIRPATETKDYHIIPQYDSNWLTLGGIRSTGLTSSLGVADMAAEIVQEQFGLEPSNTPVHALKQISVRFAPNGSAILDDCSYEITHPICLFGNIPSASKL